MALLYLKNKIVKRSLIHVTLLLCYNADRQSPPTRETLTLPSVTRPDLTKVAPQRNTAPINIRTDLIFLCTETIKYNYFRRHFETREGKNALNRHLTPCVINRFFQHHYSFHPPEIPEIDKE